MTPASLVLLSSGRNDNHYHYRGLWSIIVRRWTKSTNGHRTKHSSWRAIWDGEGTPPRRTHLNGEGGIHAAIDSIKILSNILMTGTKSPVPADPPRKFIRANSGRNLVWHVGLRVARYNELTGAPDGSHYLTLCSGRLLSHGYLLRPAPWYGEICRRCHDECARRAIDNSTLNDIP